MKWGLLFVGGGIGAVLRVALSLAIAQRFPGAFPWGTLAVNVLGCFAIGVLATLADEGELLSSTARFFLVAGLLGGFTTFSTFGMETLQLVEARALGQAAGYVGGSLALGFVAVALGVFATRSAL